MIKLLIGGSPCTYWSIAQKNNRETEPSGMGWELFKNYLIAKEKFKPDFFLYENNKSAAQSIKDEIKKQFGVWDGSFLMEDTGARYIEINSALVSAQNRQRFYIHNCGEVEQPKDRGILLRDILESGITWREKSLCIDANYYKATNGSTPMERQSGQKLQVAEHVCVSQRGRYSDSGNRIKKSEGKIEQYYEAREGEKTNALIIVQKDNLIDEPVNITVDGKAHTIKAQYFKNGIANFITNGEHIATAVAEPVRIGDMDRKAQAHRIYSIDGKSVCINLGGGGLGAKTGLYAVPICLRYERTQEGKRLRKEYEAGQIHFGFNEHRMLSPRTDGKTNTISTVTKDNLIAVSIYYGAETVEFDENGKPIKACSYADGKTYPVYEVRDGLITIKDKQYPIKLKDGYYIICKLTVTECCRLQTMPDNYCRAVSNAQAYKGLGNGWTAEVIIHILNGALKDIPRDEKIVVLSMYDGIGTGRYCLDKMGFTNVEYYASEIDKYAMQIAKSNYPDIRYVGDAYNVRNDDWSLEKYAK